MAKVTFREKVLLLVLSMIVILVGGFTLLVFPLKAENEVLSDTVSNLEVEQITMSNTIAQNKKYLGDIKEVEKEIHKSLSEISDPVKTEWFDINLNNYAKNRDLEILEIDYQEDVATYPEIKYPQGSIKYELRDEINKINKQTGSDDEDAIADYEVIQHPMKLVAKGNIKNLALFMDDLYSEKETIYIDEFEYDYENKTVSMNIEVYSIDKILNKKTLDMSVQKSQSDKDSK
ncbi:hypothetical protein ERUR111494_01115 [Erysipelothrix urinaevulpis]|uniref:hypothetical protein n=1 Tax=Erysipelothrix urinaevulpis TaxID=2683717 RepID=UPI001358FFFD|nr:hypothetical protein [Erysipelothrix urinaevulpis]